MDKITTLGQHIRELREKQDCSLRELATKLKVSAAFLSDVELGRRHPSERVLVEIARLLQTSIEDLEKHDTRAPVAEIRGLTNADPIYGLAFRKLADGRFSSSDLLRIAEQGNKPVKKKK